MVDIPKIWGLLLSKLVSGTSFRDLTFHMSHLKLDIVNLPWEALGLGNPSASAMRTQFVRVTNPQISVLKAFGTVSTQIVEQLFNDENELFLECAGVGNLDSNP